MVVSEWIGVLLVNRRRERVPADHKENTATVPSGVIRDGPSRSVRGYHVASGTTKFQSVPVFLRHIDIHILIIHHKTPNMTAPQPILDLPIDILRLIFSYLDAPSFLHLTATCDALHQPIFLHDSTYWSAQARHTFRVPNCPVVQHDGQRWHKLFKRLCTQSRIYTWGNNEKGCLGHSRDGDGSRRYASWPESMVDTEGIGVVADVQCGGWSTTFLTDRGALYTSGLIDNMSNHPLRMAVPRRMLYGSLEPTRLQYPRPLQNGKMYDARTAVRQFSAGRRHILALSDGGQLWTWSCIGRPADRLALDELDVGPGKITHVVAGWNHSAALVHGTGIVVWQTWFPESNHPGTGDANVLTTIATVPGSNGNLPGRNSSSFPKEDELDLVRNFVLLEDAVLFNTSSGRVFAVQIGHITDPTGHHFDFPIELSLGEGGSVDETFATDVQGSFRSFAVFTRSGNVLTGHQDRLKERFERVETPRPLFTRVPALQHKNVIQLAFGDWHFHALHASGYITSYGTEPSGCGALGLGGDGGAQGHLRGMRYSRRPPDGSLIPHAYTEGRRVWFEREKRAWIQFLAEGGVDPAEAMQRKQMALDSDAIHCGGEVSEWIEQQGTDWEAKFGLQAHDEDGLGAYFALGVAASGWHSAALVLVNEDLAQKLKDACEFPDAPTPTASLPSSPLNTIMNYGRWALGLPPHSNLSSPFEQTSAPAGVENPVDYGAAPRPGYKYVWHDTHFPRLRLSDGTEMPGSVPFDEWRFPRPQWDLSFRL